MVTISCVIPADSLLNRGVGLASLLVTDSIFRDNPIWCPDVRYDLSCRTDEVKRPQDKVASAPFRA